MTAAWVLVEFIDYTMIEFVGLDASMVVSRDGYLGWVGVRFRDLRF